MVRNFIDIESILQNVVYIQDGLLRVRERNEIGDTESKYLAETLLALNTAKFYLQKLGGR